ncbi:MAG TPA: hypothetical protein VHF05_02450 [Candidatus Paceibacterota bacterium]|jgi:hypothetical protein|nr:hypothetical protein [Candidatus Paceibacterota bacterium]
MSKKAILWTIVALLIIVSAGFYYFNTRQSWSGSGILSATASVQSFRVEKPDFVIEGSNLAKVEIWAVPSGTGVTEDEYQKIGDATQSADNPQKWMLPIPSEPILATDIIARAYDTNGHELGKMSLGIIGATELYNALWATSTEATGTPSTMGTVRTLGVGDSAAWDNLTIKLNSVDSDSCCPEGVDCIWAGNVTATLAITQNGAESTEKIDSTKSLLYKGYAISIESVSPKPTQGEKDFSTYELGLSVKKQSS